MFLPCTKREKGLARVKQSACLGAAIPHVFFVYYSKTWSYPFFKFRNGKCKFNARCSFYIHVVSAILSRGGGGGGLVDGCPFWGGFSILCLSLRFRCVNETFSFGLWLDIFMVLNKLIPPPSPPFRFHHDISKGPSHLPHCIATINGFINILKQEDREINSIGYSALINTLFNMPCFYKY